jgi:RNA polymerase sigma-70 factor, ECF subfamily
MIEKDETYMDTSSFDEMMEAYGESIKRLIYTYVNDWAVTEDLTQEVFLKVYLSVKHFEHRSSLKTWIYRIAINKCKDYMKSWHYKRVKLFHLLPDSFLIDRSNNPESHVIQNDEEILTAKAVLALPVKYREIIVLFYYREMQIADIKNILGLKESTIKTRLQRGREKLKVLLGGVEFE